jgi:hypothetical protein
MKYQPRLPSPLYKETGSSFVMPAEAGIQSVGENKNFKDLDSRFRGNDGIFSLTTQSQKRKAG